jgi:hypothetical protein
MSARDHADALLTSLRTAREHGQSETTNDIDAVMATVSRQVCYVMPDFTLSDPTLIVLTEREQVRGFYEDERTTMEVVDSAHIATLASDWYAFYEGVATTRSVADGNLYNSNHVVLFPVAEDGIIGEILWARRSFRDVYGGVPAPPPPVAPAGVADLPWLRWRHQQLHDRFLDALRDGDVEAAVAAFAPDARVAVRDHREGGGPMLQGNGAEVVRERCRMLVDSVQDREISLLNRLAGDWYVFVEWVVRGRAAAGALRGIPGGARVQLRLASIFPVTDEPMLRAELGYGLEATVLDG